MHSTRPLTQFATELRDWLRRALEPGAPPLPFGDLARQLFALQYAHNAPYRRWCEARGATPANVTDWRQIPALPAASFKELELTCLPAEERVTEFHSSGTTARISAEALVDRVAQAILSPSPRPSPAGRGETASRVSASLAPILEERAATGLPLPAGEGRGEGERLDQPDPSPDTATNQLHYQPSRHLHSHESLALYEASLTAWFQPHLLPRSSRGNETPFNNRSNDAGREGIEVSLVASTATNRDETPRLFTADFVHFVALSPSPALAPHSSLAHMFATVQREFGHGPAQFFGELDSTGAWTLNLAAITTRLEQAIAHAEPVILLGTAFSFVHLLDALAERDITLALPAGSRVMETGGYKGRSRELPKTELHRTITARLGIPAAHIVCEYGMSELSSQAYAASPAPDQPERLLSRPAATLSSIPNGGEGRGEEAPMCQQTYARWGETPSSRVSPERTWLDGVSPHPVAISASSHSSLRTTHFHFPPWARAAVISPETGREVSDGESGLLRVLDLANVWSVLAIQTEDLAVRRGDGFELLGRAAAAEPRGCSLLATA